eukprot:scaffold1034_cov418-Prasinococcus_capsulatus_cf.AAC.41
MKGRPCEGGMEQRKLQRDVEYALHRVHDNPANLQPGDPEKSEVSTGHASSPPRLGAHREHVGGTFSRC